VRRLGGRNRDASEPITGRATRRRPKPRDAGVAVACLVAASFGSRVVSEEPVPPIGFCQRPEPGSTVAEPKELRSHDGVLELDLAIRNQRRPDGSTRYCYLTPDGRLSPTLRLKLGDLLILQFKNGLTDPGIGRVRRGARARPAGPPARRPISSQRRSDPCVGGAMTSTSANLHFTD
jgi:hypothetical protein